MHNTPAVVEKRIELSAERADRLSRLAQAHHISENQFIEKALDILFTITDLYEVPKKTEENYSDLDREELFKQKLHEAGLLLEIRKPYDFSNEDDFEPIQVKGKPLSEMIIEERQ
ncbi:MAG: hypothetical protein HY326_12090 [Chloroflexi bacterium]|nr:hypothetical protein [Chloroflexota bacterium]